MLGFRILKRNKGYREGCFRGKIVKSKYMSQNDH